MNRITRGAAVAAPFHELGRGLAVAALVALAVPLRAEPAVGKSAPAFALRDSDGKQHALKDYRGRHVVLEWVNHGCPFVRKHYDSGNMQALQKEYAAKGVVWLSVGSSAEGKQGHFAPEGWKKISSEKGASPTAVLLDPEGVVGKLYGAKTTPHMFVIDPAGVLIYKGGIDDRPSTDAADIAGANNHVRAALEESLSGKPVSRPSAAPYGCSVKYK